MNATSQRPGDEDRLRLSAHPVLHDLRDDVRDELIEQFRIQDVDAGVHVLEEGGLNSRLFIVLKGAVSVRLPKQGRRFSQVNLATLGPGETFGEYSLFDGQPVSAAVYATEPTRVASLEKTALDTLIDGHPETARRFYEGVIRILVSRLRAKNAELDLITIG
jgi:CRP/FNR family transcriptional regulator, cyclic AMP receptor protein